MTRPDVFELLLDFWPIAESDGEGPLMDLCRRLQDTLPEEEQNRLLDIANQ